MGNIFGDDLNNFSDDFSDEFFEHFLMIFLMNFLNIFWWFSWQLFDNCKSLDILWYVFQSVFYEIQKLNCDFRIIWLQYLNVCPAIIEVCTWSKAADLSLALSLGLFHAPILSARSFGFRKWRQTIREATDTEKWQLNWQS